MKKNLLVITPIKQIRNLEKLLKKNFNTKIIENPNYKDIKKIIHKYHAIFTNPNMSNVYLSKNLMESGKNLKIICTASTGTNHIDIKFAKKKAIKIINLRKKKNVIKKISSTAEHSLALTLAGIRKIPQSIESVKKKKWDYRPFLGRQLNFIKVGIIGYGRLGKLYAKFLKPLVKEILVFEKKKNNFKDTKKIKFVTLNYLKKNSDIISIHIHADKENLNLINKKFLNNVKKNILLVNTSRGEIVNEKDLLDFLKKNKKSIYATDVISGEVKNKSLNKIFKNVKTNKQLIVTPHIGGMTQEAQEIAYYSVSKDLILNR